MSSMLFLVVVICLRVHCYHDDNVYRAAIVSLDNRTTVDEFYPYINQAKGVGAEIVVFPELSLLMLPEKVEFGETVCDNPENYVDKPVQYRLSSAAKNFQIYIALSIFEHGEECDLSIKEDCLFGFYLYNTEVVFDRTGTVIAKYRKTHSFLGFMREIIHDGNGTAVYFDTDFGVRFGTFVCFDIFYPDPQVTLLDKYQIEQFVFSEDWYDVIPVTALTWVQGWSKRHEVIVLAANNQEDKLGYESTGSGILYKGEPLIWTIEQEAKMLVTDVPKKLEKKSKKPKFLPSKKNKLNDHFKLQNESFVFEATPGYEEKDLVLEVDNVKCTFSFKVTDVSTPSPQYFILMSTSFLFEVLEFEACFIQNCGDTKESCSTTIANKKANKLTTTLFDYVEMKSEYTYPDELLYVLPVSGTNEKAVFLDGQWEEEVVGDTTYKMNSTDKLSQPLLFVGHIGVVKQE